MAQPSLDLVWQEYQARVGSYLGWGRGAAYGDSAWSDQQQFEIDGVVASALRNFYYPSPIDGINFSWSFLRPTASLTLASAAQTVVLPNDFGAPEGQVTILGSASQAQPWTITWRNEAQVRERYSVFPGQTGPPMFVSLQALKGTQGQLGQRWQLFLFPTADQAYTLQMQYSINPDYLSTPFPYAYGGPQHAETILESCLAVAEARLDDAESVHRDLFERRMAASMALDRRNQPQNLGPNLDRSDWIDQRVNPHGWSPAVTYNSQPFE